MKTYGVVLEYAIQQKQHGHDVFVDYSAHVDMLRVAVFEHGWESGKEFHEMREKTNKVSPQDFIHFIRNTLQDDDTEEHY